MFSRVVSLSCVLALPAHCRTRPDRAQRAGRRQRRERRIRCSIGEYYASNRAIPPEQVLRLTDLPADPPTASTGDVFERAIQAPSPDGWPATRPRTASSSSFSPRASPSESTAGKDNSAASVDSELSLLYLRMTGARPETPGPLPNPYFLGDRPLAEARPFTREAHQLYLVTRLDGFTVDDVVGPDRPRRRRRSRRSIRPGRQGVVDREGQRLAAGGGRPAEGEGRVRRPRRLQLTATVVTDQVDVLGYYSWGSNDPAIRRRTFNLNFAPGAIGGMFVSTDGRTFREPPAELDAAGLGKQEGLVHAARLSRWPET